MNQKGTSWAVIVIMFIIFWPIGLFLLIRKLSSDKAATMHSGRNLNIAGFALIIIGAINFFNMSPYRRASSIITSIFMIAGGIVLIRMAKKMKVKADKYRKYIAMVANQNMTSIDNIAAAIPIDYDTAVKDLQEMIDKGYFPQAYINAGTREIIVPHRQVAAPQPVTMLNSAVAVPQARVVACGSCGANNTIIGAVGECEYCGSPIS